ncbi:MAG: hypothetical protein Q9162_002266 [Coniocarpon cinnabarinum]
MSNSAQDRGRTGFFSAARRMLRAGTNASKTSLKPISENHALGGSGQNEKSIDPEKEGYDPSGTTGTPPKEIAIDEEAEDRDRRRTVRTIPPWIHSFAADESSAEQDQRSYLLPSVPFIAQPPHRNFTPEPKHNAAKGRRFDYAREWDPVTARRPLALTAPHWQSFTAAATPPKIPEEPGTIMDDEWEKENFKDLDSPWNPVGMGIDTQKPKGFWLFNKERRRAAGPRVHRTLMQNSFVPLVLRLVLIIFVAASLGTSASIFSRTNSLNHPFSSTHPAPSSLSDDSATCQQQPSTYLAVILATVAILYLFYITWDEFSSKPLGLRRSSDKIRLLFLDPIFFVFGAANVSIAMNTLLDRQWACFENLPGGPAKGQSGGRENRTRGVV